MTKTSIYKIDEETGEMRINYDALPDGAKKEIQDICDIGYSKANFVKLKEIAKLGVITKCIWEDKYNEVINKYDNHLKEDEKFINYICQ